MVTTNHIGKNIVLIGTGNMATHLGVHIKSCGYNIVQIYNHSEPSAIELAEKLSCPYTCNPQMIVDNADLYIFAVKDSVLASLIREIKPNNGLWVHTAGSIPQSVFEGHTSRYGVLYALQTLSKQRRVDFTAVPLFVEANSCDDSLTLAQFAQTLTRLVNEASSEQRKQIHLAAVFVNNFGNHLATIASSLLQQHNLPFETLIPLIDETAAKLHELSPMQAQTGPAVRCDQNVMKKQCALLPNQEMKDIYQLLSESISHYHQKI